MAKDSFSLILINSHAPPDTQLFIYLHQICEAGLWSMFLSQVRIWTVHYSRRDRLRGRENYQAREEAAGDVSSLGNGTGTYTCIVAGIEGMSPLWEMVQVSIHA